MGVGRERAERRLSREFLRKDVAEINGTPPDVALIGADQWEARLHPTEGDG